jgi:hypothetical protein
VLICLVILSFVVRAHYTRRRFQRIVEASIRDGQPLPVDAALALGLIRPAWKESPKAKVVSPQFREVVMVREQLGGGEKEGWDIMVSYSKET